MPEDRKKTVKDWPEDERPRERLLKHGPSSLSDAQLLAIIIRSGEGGRSAVDVGRELLERFESLAGIEQAGIRELCGIKGIGPAKAAEIKAALELGKRWFERPTAVREHPDTVNTSRDVAVYYRQKMRGLRREYFKCALLDVKNKIIKDVDVSTGTLTASLVHPRETFMTAVRESAAAVIFIHNHPSGDVRPSQEDILLTKRLVQAGEVLGIRVLDHIIVSDGNHFSFRDQGLMAGAP